MTGMELFLKNIWQFLIPLQKLPKSVRDLGKLIVAKALKKLSKVQKIAQSGHTGRDASSTAISMPNPTLNELNYYINV